MRLAPHDRPVTRLLKAHQTAAPDSFVESLSAAVAAMGGRDVILYLVDYEHVALTSHPGASRQAGGSEVVTVDGSVAGRAFSTMSTIAAEHDDGWHVWVPVSDQSDRLGVLALTVPEWDDEIEDYCSELGLAVAPLLIAGSQYTDLPHLLRRRKNMGLAAEMQWSLLPPLAFAASGVRIAGLLEPAYEVGGDCFDYAFNGGRLDFMILDTVGHGLGSAVLAALLVGAYRHGRRAGLSLPEIATGIDAAARTHPGQPAFATAVLGHLDSATGRLTWMTCGHVQPVVVRRGTTLPPVDVKPGLPLGLGSLAPVVGDLIEVDLEPGDGVLMFTDGVVEARTPSGEFLGEQQLRDLLEREHGAGHSPQEIVRRLVRTTLEHCGADLRDDASLVYLRWDGPEAEAPAG